MKRLYVLGLLLIFLTAGCSANQPDPTSGQLEKILEIWKDFDITIWVIDVWVSISRFFSEGMELIVPRN